jgi:hypothetical protein
MSAGEIPLAFCCAFDNLKAKEGIMEIPNGGDMNIDFSVAADARRFCFLMAAGHKGPESVEGQAVIKAMDDAGLDGSDASRPDPDFFRSVIDDAMEACAWKG